MQEGSGQGISYGHFNQDNKEYIITNPETPQAWSNYLYNSCYHAIVSHTGGGFSYWLDPRRLRLCKGGDIYTDRPGRYVFIRDTDTGAVWTPNWQPFRNSLDLWQARHGIGYTVLSAEKTGVYAQISYLVTMNDPVELWLIRLENRTSNIKHIEAYPFVEFVAGDNLLIESYRTIFELYNRAYYDVDINAIVAFNQPSSRDLAKHPGYVFLSSSILPSGYETRKRQLLGRYNDIQNPEAILAGNLGNNNNQDEDMVGVFQLEIDIEPLEVKEFVVVLGITDDKGNIADLVGKYRGVSQAKMELKNIKNHWEKIINKLNVKTAEIKFDRMINIWVKYQLDAITHWRGTSPVHGVDGGLGTRDRAQDIEGLVLIDPVTAKTKLLELLSHQYDTGQCVAGWSIEAEWHNIANENGVVRKSDVAVWLVYTVVSYIKETGDIDILEQNVKFVRGGDASIYEHLLRAVRYIYGQRGERGLPLIGLADWNDSLDEVGVEGKGESVWLAMALCRACLQMKELAEFTNDQTVAAEMQEKYGVLHEIINSVGWDGEWYLMAFNDKGRKVGTKENLEGQVPLNTQTWAILSDVVSNKRLPIMLNSIKKHLDTPYGPRLFYPPYSRYDSGIGRVSSFAPGTKENGAVFSHAVAYTIVAYASLGLGDLAYETLMKLLPSNPAKNDPDRYGVEPFILTEYVLSPESQTKEGQGGFPWNTGTAPWVMMAAIEWILGARRDFRGLLIAPCFPSHWREASIRRPFRGAEYNITIRNPDGVQSGVKQIKVDGDILNGTVIPPHSDCSIHEVEVIMG